MIDERLRRADPVADEQFDTEAAPARAMLSTILATPRDRRPVRRARRLAVAAAGVLAVTAGTVVWSGGRPHEAYALDTRPDGSVTLTLRWEELDDVELIASALRRAGVPTRRTEAPPEGFCAPPEERDRASYALNEFHPGAEQPASTEGYVMRPRLFPPGSVLVLATYDDVVQKLHMTLFYLAPAGNLSCAVSGSLGRMSYYGPQPYPTMIRFSLPPEGP